MMFMFLYLSLPTVRFYPISLSSSSTIYSESYFRVKIVIETIVTQRQHPSLDFIVLKYEGGVRGSWPVLNHQYIMYDIKINLVCQAIKPQYQNTNSPFFVSVNIPRECHSSDHVLSSHDLPN